MTESTRPPDAIASVAASWHAGTELATADIDEAPVRALAAVLDADADAVLAAAELPPFWHWLYFLSWVTESELGPDGHPAVGPLLPPLPNRRRMFAGGQLAISSPLRLGEPAQRRATVIAVEPKAGRSGEQLFVTVRAEIRQRGELAITDDQQLVYRSATGDAGPPAPGRPSTAPADAAPAAEPEVWRTDQLRVDSRMLFRFSALTANTHRIHYDQAYATTVEGFAGLVVHGPLQAILLAEQVRARHPQRQLAGMRYRFQRPTIGDEPFVISGNPTDDGERLRLVAMTGLSHAVADATFSGPIVSGAS